MEGGKAARGEGEVREQEGFTKERGGETERERELIWREGGYRERSGKRRGDK